MSTAHLETLGRKLDETAPALAALDSYYRGQQPAAFLSPTAQAALADRLRVLDRADEVVDLGVGRDGVRERPPELDSVEPGGAGCGGALEQRELGVHDRAVDLVPEPVRHGYLPLAGSCLPTSGT